MLSRKSRGGNILCKWNCSMSLEGGKINKKKKKKRGLDCLVTVVSWYSCK